MGYIDLLNYNVKHKKWGLGIVVEQNENNIWVEFTVGKKQFPFPSAFEQFLDVEDRDQREIIDELILEAKNAEVQRELQTTKTALVAEQNKSLWQVIKEKVLGK